MYRLIKTGFRSVDREIDTINKKGARIVSFTHVQYSGVNEFWILIEEHNTSGLARGWYQNEAGVDIYWDGNDWTATYHPDDDWRATDPRLKGPEEE